LESVGNGTNFHFNKIFPTTKKLFVSTFTAAMPDSFSKQLTYEKKALLAVIIPQLRKNGMHYEVNIKGYPRFYMVWSALGRYDVAGDDAPAIPYPLILEVSDAIEKR
jgi:hypothetical protein